MGVRKLEVDVRVSKVMCSREDDYVSLTIEDRTSGIQFASFDIPFEAFGRLLGGVSSVRLAGEFIRLEDVGKVREYKRATIRISAEEYNAVTAGKGYHDQKEALGEWLKKNHSLDGWMISTCLGSQDSVKTIYEGNKTIGYDLKTGYTRYVDKQQQSSE